MDTIGFSVEVSPRQPETNNGEKKYLSSRGDVSQSRDLTWVCLESRERSVNVVTVLMPDWCVDIEKASLVTTRGRFARGKLLLIGLKIKESLGHVTSTGRQSSISHHQFLVGNPFLFSFSFFLTQSRTFIFIYFGQLPTNVCTRNVISIFYEKFLLPVRSLPGVPRNIQ